MDAFEQAKTSKKGTEESEEMAAKDEEEQLARYISAIVMMTPFAKVPAGRVSARAAQAQAHNDLPKAIVKAD